MIYNFNFTCLVFNLRSTVTEMCDLCFFLTDQGIETIYFCVVNNLYLMCLVDNLRLAIPKFQDCCIPLMQNTG
jgi:hypothetical protein